MDTLLTLPTYSQWPSTHVGAILLLLTVSLYFAPPSSHTTILLVAAITTTSAFVMSRLSTHALLDTVETKLDAAESALQDAMERYSFAIAAWLRAKSSLLELRMKKNEIASDYSQLIVSEFSGAGLRAYLSDAFNIWKDAYKCVRRIRTLKKGIEHTVHITSNAQLNHARRANEMELQVGVALST
ncbi:hypothetical protein MKEN_01079100 [Mycena kentingensis (nom. inval.)]|nr:hypothetical protein MKEN_01079100 [Mycena kentingensis (nom. inval.)]